MAKFTKPIPFRGIVKMTHAQPCEVCNQLTHFKDIDFGLYLCSDECQLVKIESHSGSEPKWFNRLSDLSDKDY